MVSGETIVRDLQLGIARATELGGAMQVGYLPDMFGHVAQMPQILRARRARARGRVARRAGGGRRRPRSGGRRPTAHACAPSTSTARTRTAATSRTTRSSSSRARARLRAELGDARLAGRRHAADERHRPPDAAAVARPRRRRGERDAGRLPVRGHVAARVPRRAADRRARRRGAASCARAHGRTCSWAWRRTGSTCTRRARPPSGALERRAEPLERAVPPARPRTPTRCSRIAWRNLVLNSAHDSSCACSADEVVDAVRRALPGGAPDRRRRSARDALHALATEVDAPPASTIVVNPTQRRPRRPGRGHRARRRARCTSSRSTTARRARPRWSRASTGDGFSTMVIGPEGALGRSS